MNSSAKNSIIFALISLLFFITCKSNNPYQLIPSSFVYTIIEHNNSLYYSTPSGKIFRIHPDNPDSITSLGVNRFYPIRSLAFSKNGNLYAASYQTGVHKVEGDTLLPQLKMGQMAWSMKIDSANTIWLAGNRGIFRQQGDTLIKFTDLSEAYDVDFYRGKLAIAHRRGITLYDSKTALAETTFCKGITCWAIDIYDTLLIGGGVETCILVNGSKTTTLKIGPAHNIPWAAVRNRTGTIFLATQRGLYRIQPGETRAKCIDFKGKCIKSLFIDKNERLWIGRYFKPKSE